MRDVGLCAPGSLELASLALAVSLLFGCDEPPAAIRPEPIAAAAEIAEPPEPPRPWAVRFVRACSLWTASALGASEERVVACGAVYDRASGALLSVAPEGREYLGAHGSTIYWRTEDALLAEDGDVRPVRSRERITAIARAAPELIAIGSTRLHRLRGAVAEPIAGSEPCISALAVRLEGDAVQCLVDAGEAAELRTSDRARELPAASYARWNGHGHWIAIGRGAARWITPDGTIAHTREAPLGLELLDVSPEGAALVSGDHGTELWKLEGDDVVIEPVYGRRVGPGRFAGDEIVVTPSAGGVVWLHRGAPRREPELEPPETPRGFVALRADVDADRASFEGDAGIFNRAPTDVAAFLRERPWTYIVVSHGDAAELSRFEDDARWARMAAARYLELGTERWARWWRGEEGRVLRGHYYIGGCERSHNDVVIRERGDVLEIRTVTTSSGRGVDAILGPIPEGATDVPEARADEYRGDPSIGPR